MVISLLYEWVCGLGGLSGYVPTCSYSPNALVRSLHPGAWCLSIDNLWSEVGPQLTLCDCPLVCDVVVRTVGTLYLAV